MGTADPKQDVVDKIVNFLSDQMEQDPELIADLHNRHYGSFQEGVLRHRLAG